MTLPDAIHTTDLTQLLQIAVWGGLCAGALAIWRASWLRTIVVVQATAIAIVTAILTAWSTTDGFEHAVTLGRWLTLPGDETASISIIQYCDGLTSVFLLACSVAVAVFASRRDDEETPSAGICRGVFWFLSYQAMLQFVLSADLILQLAFWQFLSLTILLWVAGDRAATNNAVTTARRTFLFRLTADGVLLAALLLGANHNTLTAVSPSAGGLSETVFGLLLFIAVLGRCCPFPFLSRDRFAGMPRDAVWLDRLIVSPVSVLLLGRCRLLFASSDVAWNAIVIGGAGLALLAGITALLRPGGNQRVDMVSLSLTGLMLAGVGSGTTEGFHAAAVLFLSHAVLIAVAESRPSVASRTTAVAGILLCCGAAGQGLVVSALVRVAERNPTELARTVAAPTLLWGAVIVLGIAHLLTAFAMGGWLRNRITDNALLADHRPIHSTRLAVLSGLVLVGLTGIVAMLSWNRQPVTPDGFVFLLTVLSGLIGMTCGWSVARPIPLDAEICRTGIRGLPADGWRLDRLFLQVVIAPLGVAAALCRFAEWFFIEWLWSVPALLPRLLQRVEESLQTDSLRRAVCAALLAATLLSLVIALGN